jgi:hypothetical protein
LFYLVEKICDSKKGKTEDQFGCCLVTQFFN